MDQKDQQKKEKRRKAPRGRGEGSIHQRAEDGLWVASRSLPVGPGGRRKRISRYGRTKKEAFDKLKELMLQSELSFVHDKMAAQLTVAQYLDQWFELTASTNLGDNAKARDRSMIESHLKPHLGHIRLDRLSYHHVELMLKNLTRVDKRAGKSKNAAEPLKELSERTRQVVFDVLRKSMKKAKERGLIPIDPCGTVERPGAEDMAIEPLTERELEQFLVAACEDRYFALWCLLASTGLREGEALALDRKYLDLDGAKLVVRRTVRVTKKARYKKPKTQSSWRTVDLDGETVEVLREHLLRMEKEGFSGPLVFCDTEGGVVRANNLLRRNFHAILRRAGLRHITIHTLRHTVATLLMGRGVGPKIVAERLGHKTVALCLQRYSHVMPTMQIQAARVMGEVLRGMSRLNRDAPATVGLQSASGQDPEAPGGGQEDP